MIKTRSKYHIGQRVFIIGAGLYGYITEVIHNDADGYRYFVKCDDGSEQIAVPEENIHAHNPSARYSYF